MSYIFGIRPISKLMKLQNWVREGIFIYSISKKIAGAIKFAFIFEKFMINLTHKLIQFRLLFVGNWFVLLKAHIKEIWAKTKETSDLGYN